eukprot:3940557-Rhodomonas_salina.4
MPVTPEPVVHFCPGSRTVCVRTRNRSAKLHRIAKQQSWCQYHASRTDAGIRQCWKWHREATCLPAHFHKLQWGLDSSARNWEEHSYFSSSHFIAKVERTKVSMPDIA